MQAASAPTAIQGFGKQDQSGAQSAAASQLSGASGTFPASIGAELANGAMGAVQSNAAGLMPGMEAGSDPNGWARKESFKERALPAEYSQHTRVFPVSAYELKAGSILPCVLISGLNSDLPGNIIGQVSENVWDTATGRLLLIPRGSRLIGTYDHQVTYGQNRALVIWSRLIFPDGSSLLLDNLQGADQAGYSGFKGRVDRHWGSMITSALLVSLMGAGVELVTDNSKNNNNNNNNNNNKSVGDVLSERVATAIAEAMTQIITKGINRQPTILIKPGYRFTIFVQHDIVFPRAWSSATGR
jgi:type IV secretion system protein VirB10